MKIPLDITPSKIASEKEVLEAIASRLGWGDQMIAEICLDNKCTLGTTWVDFLGNKVISIESDNYIIPRYQEAEKYHDTDIVRKADIK